MKKKVFILFLASFLLVNVVSAAGIWGSYKGNNIIRLTVDGVPVKVSDAPAINFDNRTMIPIYLLQQAGIKYTWDQANQTVDIEKQQVTTASTDRFSNGVTLTDLNNWAYIASYYSQMDSIYGDFTSSLGLLGVISTGITLHANDDLIEKSASELKNRIASLETRFNQFVDSNKKRLSDTYNYMNASLDQYNAVTNGYNSAMDNLFAAYNSLSNYYKNGVQSDFNDFITYSDKAGKDAFNAQGIARKQFEFWINGVILQKK